MESGLALSDVRLVPVLPGHLERTAWTVARSPSAESSRGSVFARMSTDWRRRLRLHGFVRNFSRRGAHRGGGRAARPRSIPVRADGQAAAPGPDRRVALVVPAAAAVILRSGSSRASSTRRARSSSRPMSRPAMTAWPSCSIPGIVDTDIRSSTARIAGRGSRSSPVRPTTASGRAWPGSPCVPRVARSTKTRATADSTPSRPPVRLAAPGSNSWTTWDSRSRRTTRSPGRPRRCGRG